jgi:HEAT repeat protein
MTKFATHACSTSARNNWFRVALNLIVALWLILTPFLLARGQQPEGSITLLDVTARPVSNTTLVTITADGPLNQAQTWQDQEGYHVVIPGGHPSESIKEGRGYRIRRSGSAVEVLLYTKAGASVQVNTDAKHINLSVAGELESRDAVPTSDSNQSYSLPNYGNSTNAPPVSDSSPAVASTETREPTQAVAPADSSQPQSTGEGPSTITVGEPRRGGGISNWIFSWTGTAVVVVLVAIALFFTYRSRKDSGWESDPDEATAADENAASETVPAKAKESIAVSVKTDRRKTKTDVKPAAPSAVSPYSAYRIGQEVRKLALGQPHRTEVMSSRASEDRRAIQTSLIKIISATETSEEERVRARNALEGYGFVSRECAALLSSSDPFDRTMAARTLGEIGSSAALPSLLEALHDSEAIVRNQVISSIGELRLPSAIGALLDAARNQSELPKGLVSRALAACSIESVELADAVAPSFSNDLVSDSGIFDFTQLGQTESPIEELPETIEDDSLNEALTKATSDNPEVRGEAVKTLAQFPVKSAIATLVSMAQQDQESTVRSLAVSSLGFIDHELVFPAVLIGMADESRDVRAAAARALSRLSFDRTAAYGTLVRVADDQTLRDVAQACIKAGIVSQNIDRLASRDRRQAYEAFCLISLLAKAGVTAPILEAIENHQNMGVRLSVIHLLASTGNDSVFEQLQQIAGNDELAEEIKIAALNEMYTIQQAGRREHERRNEAQLSRVNVSEAVAFVQTETDASEVSM